MSNLSELEIFYLRHDEPLQGCFLALREIILSSNEEMSVHWKWKLPFFCYKGKNLCYLWKDKVTAEAYIGFVDGALIEHKALEQGDRKRMKIMGINPNKDIPIKKLEKILKLAIALRQ